MSENFSRRTAMATAAGGALSIFLPRAGNAQANSLVSTVFGGVYEREYRKAIVDPFEKKFGIKVMLKLGAPAEWLTNAMVNRRRPEIDLLLLPYPDSIKAVVDDLGMDLSVKDIPNIADLYPIWYDQYNRQAVGLDYVSYGIGYRTDLVNKVPKSWKDIWSPEYAGKLVVPDITSAGVWEFMVVAAKLNGGSESNIEPAFKAIRALKPNIRKFYKSTVESAQLLESGEAAVCMMTTDIRTYGLADAGKPVAFVVPEEGAMVGMVSYHVAKNTPNKELCFKFIDFALSKEAQEGFCNGVSAGPTVKSAQLSGKPAERVPPLEKLLLFDWKKVVPQMGALSERWNREIAG